jgi:peptidoglycan L-alanyl-D-glutamate endopeptidase CwlK
MTLLALLFFLAPPPLEPLPPIALQCLVDAYPDHLKGYHYDPVLSWVVVWHDGTRMDWDDGREKSYQEKLDSPDLEDMMSIPYPLGRPTQPPARDEDPGRIRYDPFFKKMYGSSAKVVSRSLRRVTWLPEAGGKTIKATPVNGVHSKLGLISADLSTLSRKLQKLAARTSGPFNWRTIKGTTRLSVHSFAIALDVAVKQSHYWRWAKPAADGTIPYQNQIPYEIAAIFERHGFIWGGKWYHYDTMHFEYRPELLDRRCSRPAPQ